MFIVIVPSLLIRKTYNRKMEVRRKLAEAQTRRTMSKWPPNAEGVFARMGRSQQRTLLSLGCDGRAWESAHSAEAANGAKIDFPQKVAHK